MQLQSLCVGAVTIACATLVGKTALAQCQRDIDCGPGRVCIAGQCLTPAPAAAPPAAYPQPAPVYQQPAQPAYPQPAPVYQQPAQPGYPQPAPVYQQPAQPGYPQPAPVYQQPAQPAYPQPAPVYQQPAQPGYPQPMQPGYVQPAPAYAPSAAAVAPSEHQPGDKGIALSVERAMGIQMWSGSATPPNAPQAVEASGTVVGFLVGTYENNAQYITVNPSSVPRVAIDGFPVKGFSMGGSLGYIHISGKVKAYLPGQADQNTETTSGIVAAPRVGYLAMFSPHVGIWPRLGVTYASINVEPEQAPGTKVSVTQVNIEGNLVISPASHVAFSLGLVYDAGASGTYTAPAAGPVGTTADTDFKLSSYGLTAGLHGFF
jgi:hypothetical protein